MASPVSSKTQLSALDAAISMLRRHQLGPRSEATLIAEQLAPLRDRLARAIANERPAPKGTTSRDIASVFNEEMRRK